MLIRAGRRLRTAGNNLLVAWYAVQDPRLPWIARSLLLLFALYLISPFDLLPDAFPVLGWLDDLGLIAFALPALLRLIPEPVLSRATQRARWWKGWGAGKQR